jgi:uncharacterized membrane protein YuzA (DUF378 family)
MPFGLFRRLLYFARSRPLRAALFSCGVIVRFWRLGERSLWFDEAKSLVVAASPLGEIAARTRSLEGIPPLYFYLLHAWMGIFGASASAARAFSAVVGAAALAVFGRLCRRVVPERASFAFFLGVFSSYWIYMAQEARVYSLYLLASLFLADALAALVEDWSARRAAMYALVGAFGIYLHPYFLFTLAITALYGAWHWRRSGARRLASWTGIHALIALAYLPWLSSLLSQMSRPDDALLRAPMTLAGYGRILSGFFFDVPFLDLLVRAPRPVSSLLAGGALAAAAFVLMRGPPQANDRWGSFLAFPIVAAPIAVALGEILARRALAQGRYFAFLSPYVYLFVAWGAGRLKSALSRRAMTVGIAALALAGAGVSAWAAGRLDPRLGRLAGYLRSAADRRAVIVHAESYFYPSLRYYYLVERPQILLCPDQAQAAWASFPGYPAFVDRRTLARLPACVLIDPLQRLTAAPVGVVSCAALAKVDCGR